MASLTHYLDAKLGLKVKRTKSAVARPWERKFLGYTVTNHRSPRLKPAPGSVKRAKDRIREITHKGRGRNILKGDRGDRPLHERVDWLLSALHGRAAFRLAGSMAAPAPPQDLVGAMAQTQDPLSKARRTGSESGACPQGDRHRPKGLVERKAPRTCTPPLPIGYWRNGAS